MSQKLVERIRRSVELELKNASSLELGVAGLRSEMIKAILGASHTTRGNTLRCTEG